MFRRPSYFAVKNPIFTLAQTANKDITEEDENIGPSPFLKPEGESEVIRDLNHHFLNRHFVPLEQI